MADGECSRGTTSWLIGVAAAIAAAACSGEDRGQEVDAGLEPDAAAVCTPEVDSACFDNAVADVDSCGEPGELTEVCPCGCAPDGRSCGASEEPEVVPVDDPGCVVRTDCVTIERVVCEPRDDGMWHTETRYENDCDEPVRCAGYGTEALWSNIGLLFGCFSLNGTSWGPGQTGALFIHAYETLEECELASNIGGPGDHACVSYESPATCLPGGDLCELLCP